MPVQAKTENYQNSDDAENDADQNSELPGGALRASSGGESPLAKKIPDAYTKVKRRSQHTDHEKCEIPGTQQIIRDGCVGGASMGDPALSVKMPADINESDESGPALQGVEPVAHPGILRNVRFPA